MPHADEALGLQLPSQDPVAAVVLGASPADVKAAATGYLIVTGGTVSALAYGRDGTFTGIGIITGIVPISRGDTLRITYTVLPTVSFLKR